jgi:NitT/TauT family transport system substrate-binding protein
MKKIIVLLVILSTLALLFTGCSNQPEETVTTTLTISTSFAANSIPFFYMLEENTLGDDIDFQVNIHKTRDEATAKILKNEIDMAMLSSQEAANMYNKELDVKLLNATYGATFFLLSRNDAINDYTDLIGKEIWTSVKGGPVSFTLNQLLLNSTIDPNADVSYKFINLKELTQLVINDLKDIEVFSTREPFVSKILASNPDIKTVYNLDHEWERIFGNRIPLSGVIARNDYLKDNQDMYTLFNSKYDEAIKWVNDNPEEASQLGAKYLEGLNSKILKKSIINMNLEMVKEKNIKNELDAYFSQWLEFNPEMVGKKLPDSDFYSIIGED